jgi:hypothetical protein
MTRDIVLTTSNAHHIPSEVNKVVNSDDPLNSLEINPEWHGTTNPVIQDLLHLCTLSTVKMLWMFLLNQPQTSIIQHPTFISFRKIKIQFNGFALNKCYMPVA